MAAICHSGSLRPWSILLTFQLFNPVACGPVKIFTQVSNIEQCRVGGRGIIAHYRSPKAPSAKKRSAAFPPKTGKCHDVHAAILDSNRAPALFPLPNADDAGARNIGADRFRTPAVRMPQMQSRRDTRHFIRSPQVERVRLACRRTQSTQLREQQHARHTKPGSAVHRLRFTDEVDGNRAE